jgi:hypothetical protein
MSYTRSIAAQTSNAPPAWRAALTAVNTIYEVGLTPLASGIDAEWVYPSGSLPPRWGDSTYERTKHNGYGGAVFLPNVGMHGIWLYNQTGEGVWENNVAQWSMSADVPEFGVWQQPAYHINVTACTAAGDDIYLSAADAAALPSNRRFSGADNIPASWDLGFPFAYNDWVWRRKQQGWTLKDNQPHFWRYNTPTSVFADMSGLDVDVVVCKETILHGPFPQAWRPSGGSLTDGDFHTDLWPSGRRKYYVFWQRADTKVWTRITTPVPDMAVTDSFADHAVVCRLTRRIYYLVNTGAGLGVYYLDLSNGIANATMSALLATTGPGLQPEFDRTNVVLTDEHPTGKRLVYFRSQAGGHGPEGAERIGMLDLDTLTHYDLNLAPRGMDTGSNPCLAMTYDAPTNTVCITSVYFGNTPIMHTFPVPSDPTSAANYTVTNTTLALASGVSMESVVILPAGQRGLYHRELGTTFMPQKQNKMLGWRPSW